MRVRRLAIFGAVVALVLTVLGLGATPARADSAPPVDVGDATVTRSTTATVNLSFPITLEYASNNTVVVHYQTEDGSARATRDYTAEQGAVTFAPGSTSKTVSVPVPASTLHTGNLYLYLNLFAPTNAAVNHNNGVGTIIDPTENPYLNVSDATVTEGGGGAATAVFNVTLSSASANPVTFKYETQNGSATAGVDYTLTNGTATIAAGQTSTQVSVPVKASSAFNSTRVFYLNASHLVNANAGTTQGVGTILNSNHEAYLTVDDAEVTASTSSTSTLDFVVRLTSASTFPVTVDYGTADGSATAASGAYTPAYGTLTFSPGTTSQTVPVTVNSELSGAATQYMVLNLSNPSAGVGFARSSGTGTIGGPTTGYHELTLGDVGLVRGTSGTSPLTFTVTLIPAATTAVSVNYATQNNSAVAPGDYTATSGTLTFSAGQTTKTVSVNVVGNTTTVTDDSFYLTLSGATGATIERSSAYGIISNGNVDPVVSVDSLALAKPASGTAAAVFTVHLSSASANAVTVQTQTSDGSATAGGGDYVAKSGPLTIPAGSTTATVSVTVNGNTLAGPDTYFYLTLSSPTNAVLAGNNSALAYITNPNQNPTMTVNNVSTYVPVSGTATATFTVKLSSASTQTVTVKYATSDGTAVAGTDYVSTTGTLTFAPGATSKTVPVTVDATTIAHANRYFYLNLSSATNTSLTSTSGVATLIDDAVQPYLSVNDPTVADSSTSTTMTYAVSLSAPTPNTVTVNYTTQDGNAVAGAQYTAASGTLTFAPGTTTQNVNVTVLPSTVRTSDLYFYLTLSAPTNATLSNSASGQGTILNTNVLPGLSVGDVTVNRPTSGTATETFTVTLAPASANTVTVNYATSNGSAASTTDYTPASGSLSFSPGQTSKTVAVTIQPNASHTSDLYYYLGLSSPSNAQLERSYGVGYLIDQVAPVSGLSYLSTSDAALTLPATGSPTASFTVTLSPAATGPVSVRYTTADSSAVAGTDYTAVRGTLTFAAGQTSKTVTVPVTPSTVASADKVFNLNLSGNTGTSSILRNQGEALLLNPNPDSRLSIASDVAVIKGDSGTADAVLTVDLSPAQTQAVQVDYATADGSATAPDYYQPVEGTLTFAPGQTSQTVSVPVDSDTYIQPTTYFYLELGNPVGSTTTGQPGVCYILDPDVFTISGTVTNSTGTAVAGATITRTGNDQPSVAVTSAANGTFSIPNSIDGKYTLTPTQTGQTFLPATLAVTVRGANLTGEAFLEYTGPGITGQVVTSTGGGDSGVTVTRSGGGQATTAVTTDSLGYYAFSSVPTGTGYSITPTKSGQTANPGSYTVSLSGTTVSNRDFVMVTPAFITGQITKSGVGVAGVTVTLTGGIQASTKVTTNSQGYYGFSAVATTAGGTSYTVTPTLTGQTFTPASLNTSVSTTSNATGVNFTEN